MTADSGDPRAFPHPSLPQPPLRLAFDAEALGSNWRAMDRLSKGARTGAAVKADAYGTGVDRAVPALIKAGCRDFFVAHWSEVPAVLAHAPAVSISVLLGPMTDADARYGLETGVRPVINSIEQARRWVDAGGGKCDLMVDTGMNRLGLRVGDISDPAIAALDIEVLMSHLACADEDAPLNAQQWQAFADVLPHVRHRSASLANSAGIALGDKYHFDLTRPGLALYGGIPRSELAEAVQQVVTPEAAIVQIRRVPAGETIGYGATFTAAHDMRVAILSLGYADGYLRCWSGLGAFTAQDGAVLPVLGRVSMDLTAVDITAAPHLQEGDWLRAEYSLADAAQASGLSQYELLTATGPRLRRG
ncbi:MAG: alanine racemase [Croceicoccus sp.]|nr:alanine racemase [Croceicoccus sp.]MAL26528.1 alanine racemase [Croceicoccus sp.]|tara:strand:- start:112766 stop:113848 length:1083 start_codon:yes stop_codon:yes gene_type:complete